MAPQTRRKAKQALAGASPLESVLLAGTDLAPLVLRHLDPGSLAALRAASRATAAAVRLSRTSARHAGLEARPADLAKYPNLTECHFFLHIFQNYGFGAGSRGSTITQAAFVQELAAAPLPRLHRLGCNGALSPRDVRALLTPPSPAPRPPLDGGGDGSGDGGGSASSSSSRRWWWGQHLRELRLRGARLSARGCAALAAASSAHLSRLEVLDAEFSFRAGAVAALARGEWRALRELRLVHANLDHASLRSLCRVQGANVCGSGNTSGSRGSSGSSSSKSGGSGCSSGSSSNKSGDSGCSSNPFPALQRLDLTANNLGNAASMAVLAAAPWAPGLVKLDLSANFGHVTEDVAALAAGEWPSLEELSLNSLYVECEGVRALCRQGGFPALRRLGLGVTAIEDAGVAALASAPWASQLVQLDLGCNRISRQGAEVLAQAPLSSLEWLCVKSNRLGANGIRALLRAPWVRGTAAGGAGGSGSGSECSGRRQRPIDYSDRGGATTCGNRSSSGTSGSGDGSVGLLHLDIGDNNSAGDDVAAVLVESGPLPRLRSLGLGSSGITYDGMRRLLDAGVLAALEVLSLERNDIGLQGAMLVARAQLPCIRRLELTPSCAGGGAGAAFLSRAPWAHAVDPPLAAWGEWVGGGTGLPLG